VERANEYLRTEYMPALNREFKVAAAQKGLAILRLPRRDLDWIFSRSRSGR